MEVATNEQDLKLFFDDAVTTVFDTMLAIHLDPSTSGAFFKDGEVQVIGMVGIAGKARGVVCVRVGETLSRRAAAAMLGQEVKEVDSEADVNDVIGELTNIIAGKIKSCLRSHDTTCNLSLPTIVRGHRIDLESISGVERHSFTFSDDSEPLVVEFYSLKNSDVNGASLPKILLIDDSKATRAVVGKIFSGHQCEIIEAANGAIGLAMARVQHPSLIILDMTMPVMNGVETLEELKADSATRNIPVIMLSANSNPEEMELMRTKGVTNYVTKTQKPRIILDYALEILKLQPKPEVVGA